MSRLPHLCHRYQQFALLTFPVNRMLDFFFFVLRGPDWRAGSFFYLNTSSLQGLFVLGLEASQPQPWVFAE